MSVKLDYIKIYIDIYNNKMFHDIRIDCKESSINPCIGKIFENNVLMN